MSSTGRQVRFGRRDGRVIERVTVAVSAEMAKLRKLQQELNHFLYSTELSYGMVLTGDDPRLADCSKPVYEALSNVYASAWYPSNQGKIKYEVDISGFLGHLDRNARYVSRAVIVQWCSHFEEYLEKRVRGVVQHKQKWGPFTISLACEPLLRVAAPIRISTLLRADFCREIRNLIVHGWSDLPDSYDNADVVRWRDARTKELENGPWAAGCLQSGACSGVVMDALHYVLGQAINHRNASQREGRRENLEHFYTLFAFTNLDSLAFEIEEALLLTGALPEGRISRKATAVRRNDLVTKDAQEATVATFD